MAEVLLGRGIDRVGVEDPGSVGLREQLTVAGLTCVGVPVDEQGIRVDALAEAGLAPSSSRRPTSSRPAS